MYRILDLENQFSRQKINKAKKLAVRELEEEKKNHFVCFVDEENESYDVRIVLNTKLEIAESSCDCASKDFCLHLLAMGLFISENKTGATTLKKTTKKKISEAEVAMENLNSEELKTWLLDFFKKNKEAEVQFMLEFGEKKKDFSNEEISEIIKNTTHSVVGKKKNLTAQDVKKIVDLLTKALEPLEQFLFQNNDKQESIEKFLFLNEEIANYQMNVFSSSKRFDTFQEKLREKFVGYLNSMKDFEQWKEIATENWNIFLKKDDYMSFHFYYFIKEMYHSGDSQQKIYIAEIVRKEILVWIKSKFELRTSLKEDLLEIIAENNFFVELQKYFPIERYENSYNLKVIGEILKIDQDKAEKICKKIIDSNVNDKYNVPYYDILEKMYQERNSLEDVAYIKRKKFWEDPSIENYIFIAENDTDIEELKKFRNQVLSLLKGSFYNYPENMDLYFAILDYEKNYKKMLDVIDHNTSTSIINQYAEKLFTLNKQKFLNSINSRKAWNGSEEDEKILADFLVSKYDAAQLQEIFSKKFFGFGAERFSKMVMDKIKN
ncbi:type III secretory pathway component EscR [Chryseobacterium ginsenosidimutans]|uniref:hypothetical protein n=1 Tax=Chryseobacterium ginsenosidimutans TaxID=687846 RepID=UPI002166F927|nr:hypothetical protein [Chryseobacterium ginsenosidimutans]MCS3870438.1 type III secretory pathway component EscR [Chryseobacterium ginsenosidimutans]